MFGYVNINKSLLSKENIETYRSFYCGLCHVMGKEYGLFSRITLTYDMTFLTLFLSLFYGEDIDFSVRRCIVHPFRKHKTATTSAMQYAAAMNVALAYYNCLDDWRDDKSFIKGVEATLIKKHYFRIKQMYPTQCESIECCINELSEIENKGTLNADIPSNCFARLLGSLFVYKDDENSEKLYKFGYTLGKFIYIMDACCDLKTDLRKEKYNPLVGVDSKQIRSILDMLSDSLISDFETLGSICDNEILKNILYSGIWIRYVQVYGKNEGGDDINAEKSL